MTLDTITNEVESIRAEAKREQDFYSHTLTQIDNDTTLSPAGKDAEKEQFRAASQSRLRALRQKEEAALDREISTLMHRIESPRSPGNTDIIAFRDAQDRADRIEDDDEATRLLERALRQGDSSLAHAIFRASMDSNYRQAIKTFIRHKPELATAIEDLQRLNGAKQNSFERTVAYGFLAR
ncbi:hypothetical protein [Microbacterium aquilitoris]|uniref:hypothetical protein n=1 Tax=Microbacterium aquilitoris TaxID=3067307 RepID=UPI00288CBE02|nr:hypothetical protein [Microbacterium sp. KSW2-22]MDT3343882.1 hypothetical protein [Microbacterium sp. KSW2-22]